MGVCAATSLRCIYKLFIDEIEVGSTLNLLVEIQNTIVFWISNSYGHPEGVPDLSARLLPEIFDRIAFEGVERKFRLGVLRSVAGAPKPQTRSRGDGGAGEGRARGRSALLALVQPCSLETALVMPYGAAR